MIEAEESAIAHMNADHAEAVRLYATKLLGAADGAWRLTGLDPEGLDLALGDATLRLPFPRRVATAEELRKPWWNWLPRRGANSGNVAARLSAAAAHPVLLRCSAGTRVILSR